jgi:serine/threonine protein kinase
VAVKSVKRSKLTKKLLENLESEISILTAIRHDHIVGLIDCQVNDDYLIYKTLNEEYDRKLNQIFILLWSIVH